MDGEADGGNPAQTTGACLALSLHGELSSRPQQVEVVHSLCGLAFLFFSVEICTAMHRLLISSIFLPEFDATLRVCLLSTSSKSGGAGES